MVYCPEDGKFWVYDGLVKVSYFHYSETGLFLCAKMGDYCDIIFNSDRLSEEPFCYNEGLISLREIIYSFSVCTLSENYFFVSLVPI